MMDAEKLSAALREHVKPEKAEFLPRFFKTGKGGYAEGDKFLGVMVPDIRAVAKTCRSISYSELEKLLHSGYHEERMLALMLLERKFKSSDEAGRQLAVNFYLSNTACINNWDLVDLSAPNIIGVYLSDKDRSLLYRLAESSNLWENRISIVSTYAFIKKGDLDDTFRLAALLLQHQHELIHKAVGWMLREAGKRDERRLICFLDENKTNMSRTTLRYAVERLQPDEKKRLMQR